MDLAHKSGPKGKGPPTEKGSLVNPLKLVSLTGEVR